MRDHGRGACRRSVTDLSPGPDAGAAPRTSLEHGMEEVGAMRISATLARERFSAAAVARLATVTPPGPRTWCR